MSTRARALVPRALVPLALVVLALPLAGCGGQDDTPTVTVFAAASLTSAFEEIAEEFEAEHDGVEVALSFGGSSDLVTQVQEGAPADVLASADAATMERLVADGLTGAPPQTFATNTLTIAVPPGNPAGVERLADLGRPGLDLVVCAPEVPCGAAARAVAASAGVTLAPVSEEQSVTDVLGKVASGEAEAGLVYVTDVAAAGGDVKGVSFPESRSVVNDYPIAPVAGAEEADLVAEFVATVLGASGRRILAEHGFGAP